MATSLNYLLNRLLAAEYVVICCLAVVWINELIYVAK